MQACPETNKVIYLKFDTANTAVYNSGAFRMMRILYRHDPRIYAVGGILSVFADEAYPGMCFPGITVGFQFGGSIAPAPTADLKYHLLYGEEISNQYGNIGTPCRACPRIIIPRKQDIVSSSRCCCNRYGGHAASGYLHIGPRQCCRLPHPTIT